MKRVGLWMSGWSCSAKDQPLNPAQYLLHGLTACVTNAIVYHVAARGIYDQRYRVPHHRHNRANGAPRGSISRQDYTGHCFNGKPRVTWDR